MMHKTQREEVPGQPHPLMLRNGAVVLGDGAGTQVPWCLSPSDSSAVSLAAGHTSWAGLTSQSGEVPADHTRADLKPSAPGGSQP